jgi:hypothetical protein
MVPKNPKVFEERPMIGAEKLALISIGSETMQ